MGFLSGTKTLLCETSSTTLLNINFLYCDIIFSTMTSLPLLWHHFLYYDVTPSTMASGGHFFLVLFFFFFEGRNKIYTPDIHIQRSFSGSDVIIVCAIRRRYPHYDVTKVGGLWGKEGSEERRALRKGGLWGKEGSEERRALRKGGLWGKEGSETHYIVTTSLPYYDVICVTPFPLPIFY